YPRPWEGSLFPEQHTRERPVWPHSARAAAPLNKPRAGNRCTRKTALPALPGSRAIQNCACHRTSPPSLSRNLLRPERPRIVVFIASAPVSTGCTSKASPERCLLNLPRSASAASLSTDTNPAVISACVFFSGLLSTHCWHFVRSVLLM